MSTPVEVYECIGICQPDPATGRCTGCGRPLNAAAAPAPAKSALARTRTSKELFPDPTVSNNPWRKKP